MRANRYRNLLLIVSFSLVNPHLSQAVCNQPPIPNPGETVTWTTANSPFQICSELTIPKRGTVIVQPGVVVEFQEHTLTVSGTIKMEGQQSSPITISASGNFPPAITLAGGSLSIKFATFTGQLRGGPGKMTISDTTFTGPNGLLFTLDILPPNVPPLVKLNRCTFVNSQMQFTDTYVVLKDCSFANTFSQVLRGYALLQGTNTVDGLPLSILRETFQSIQPLFVNGVHGSNISTAGGVSLTGGSFFLGNANVFQGNLYPVDVE